MSNYHHSGPAFPVHETPDSSDSPGVTLRDYFAAKAMQELMSQDGVCDEAAARGAYLMADLMLKERAK